MTDPFTTAAFAEWLDKDPRKRFALADASNCALTQYARALGYDGSSIDFNIISADGEITIPGLFDVMNSKHREPLDTFGALATRLRS